MKKLLALLLVFAMALGMIPAIAEGGWDGAYMEADEFKAYIKHDLDVLMEAIEDQLEDDAYEAVKAALEAGQAAIDTAGTVAEVEAAYNEAFAAMSNAIPLAEGLYSYMKESNAERTNILGLLEQYAVLNGLTGITLFENGGYAMYNPRVTLGTENYIVGYGFGTLEEGNITADLEYETNDAWKRYYHTYEIIDPGTLNILNDQSGQVASLYNYIGASFYTLFMNETKDGYEWVPELAKEKPVAVDDQDGDGMAKTWRFEVRTGEADGLKYKTGSELESRKAFDDRPVALEDYETPFKLLLTQANQLYRGAELANSTAGAIAGAKEFYQATEGGYIEEAWPYVGVRTYVEDGKNYFEVTYAEETTRFFAMYYISATLYSPIPQDFIDLVTVQNYLGYNSDSTETPRDNSLSVAKWYVERYDQDQQIVFAKNPNYVFADTKCAISGVHVKILTAAAVNATKAFDEFLAGHLDYIEIPQEYLDEYRNDPRTKAMISSYSYKLCVNATDAATWESLFGEYGTVTQTPRADYWQVKPVLSNAHFVKALSYSIDRQTFANARGNIPSVDYLSSNYMSDPENGGSYSTTEAHKKAVKTLLDDTDGYGYSLELARDYFRMAMTELEAQGAYTPGAAENPTVIDIEIAWLLPTDEENYHNEVKNFLETAFNDESVTGGAYKLNVNFWVGSQLTDLFYSKLFVGRFDIGYGAVSGNTMNPLDFVSVLSSDPTISNNLTMNWSVNTNDPISYPLVYRGARFSFDALYNAANSRAIVADGQNKAILNFAYTNMVRNEDGSYTGSFTATPTLKDLTAFMPTMLICLNYERYLYGDGQIMQEFLPFDAQVTEDGSTVVTFTVPAEVAADYAIGSGTSPTPMGITGFTLLYDMAFDGNVSSGLNYSATDIFVPAIPAQ